MMQPGEKSRVLSSYALRHLIMAKQVIQRREHVDQNAVEICENVINYPLGLTLGRQKAIYAIWMTLAEGGHLRGLKKSST